MTICCSGAAAPASATTTPSWSSSRDQVHRSLPFTIFTTCRVGEQPKFKALAIHFHCRFGTLIDFSHATLLLFLHQLCRIPCLAARSFLLQAHSLWLSSIGMLPQSRGTLHPLLLANSMALPRKHILLLLYIILYYPAARLVQYLLPFLRLMSPSSTPLEHEKDSSAWHLDSTM